MWCSRELVCQCLVQQMLHGTSKVGGDRGLRLETWPERLKSFVQLDGVTDEWLKNLKVEVLADGRLPDDKRNILQYAALMQSDPVANCCAHKRK